VTCCPLAARAHRLAFPDADAHHLAARTMCFVGHFFNERER
jgi:hypothetical protein